MLRLAHRILHDHLPGKWGDDESARNADRAISLIPSSTVIVADEVDGFISQNIKDRGAINLRDDVPNWAPPFDICWVEAIVHGGFAGCLVENALAPDAMTLRTIFDKHSVQVTPEIDDPILDETVRWIVKFHCFASLRDENWRVSIRDCVPTACVGADGNLITLRFIWPSDATCPNDERCLTEKSLASISCLIGFTFSFIHCKNVVAVDSTGDLGPSDKWLRRMRLPKITYRTLNISPMSSQIKKHAADSGVSIDKAMHICRGHFRTYGDDSPGLFGKLHGTFWVPHHVRGNKEHGQVIKEYHVATE